jgi:hypothetical protein
LTAGTKQSAMWETMVSRTLTTSEENFDA